MATVTAKVKITRGRNAQGFDNLVRRVQSNANQVAYNFARGVVTQAKDVAPVRTGYLKSSIKWNKVAPGHFTIEVGAHYGRYVEYGTRYMHAQPFFRPAVELMKADYVAQSRAVFH